MSIFRWIKACIAKVMARMDAGIDRYIRAAFCPSHAPDAKGLCQTCEAQRLADNEWAASRGAA